MENLLTIEELAGKLNVKKRFIYRLTSRGEIPYIRVGGKYIRFKPSEIEAWIEEGRHIPIEIDGYLKVKGER